MTHRFIKFLFIVSVVFLVGCKSEKEYTLKMRLSKGDHFSQKQKSDMKMSFAMMGQNFDSKMKMDGAMDFDVLDSTATENNIRVTYTKMEMSSEMGGINGAPTQAADSMARIQAKNIEGRSIILTLDKQNKITNVSGFDSIYSAQAKDEKIVKMMKEFFSKESVNSMFGYLFNMYPNHPVKIGDSWKKQMEMNMAGLEMTIDYTYTLTDVKDNKANIKIDGIIKGNGKMKVMAMELDAKMDGSQKGTMAVNLENGYMGDGNYKMDMKADIDIKGQKMSMKMNGDYLIKGE